MLDETGIDTYFFAFFSSSLGFPNDPAADIALKTVKRWIEENADKVRHVRVIENTAVSLKIHMHFCRYCPFCSEF